MEWSGRAAKPNPPLRWRIGKQRELRTGEREPVLTIPRVVGIVVVRVEPRIVVVAIRTEKVRVAVRVARHAIHISILRVLKG